MNNYQTILDDLYHRYFAKFERHSDVTSSYWREVGSQMVLKKGNEWILKGHAFGDFYESTLKNRIRFLPQKIHLNYLIKKYSCPKYLLRFGKKMANRSDRIFNFDCLKQVLSLNEVLKYLLLNQLKSVCIIGDGYGYLGSLVKLHFPLIKVLSVNLGRTLFFDVFYSSKCLPYSKPVLMKSKEDFKSGDIIFLEAENYHLLKGLPIDLYINIASMQEMNPDVIENYFRYMRSSRNPYFYCCNRINKTLPDGTEINFFRYPWGKSEIIFDELCPWYKKVPSSKPPFWKKLDGAVWHRLVKIL